MHMIFGWGWLGAAMFGVLITATDPVSVIAAFKEIKVAHRLSLLVEAESLLNDGAAALGFAMLAAMPPARPWRQRRSRLFCCGPFWGA
jgi:monovalent cation:H+ antiporter, CPA1 family